MIKNLQKNIDEGAKILRENGKIDMHIGNIRELADSYLSSGGDIARLIELISNVYKIGIAVGTREGKRQAKQQEAQYMKVAADLKQYLQNCEEAGVNPWSRQANGQLNAEKA